jgi:hypothetical protein
VALGVWLTGIINLFLFGLSLGAWVLSAVFIAAIAGVGGALSLLIRR